LAHAELGLDRLFFLLLFWLGLPLNKRGDLVDQRFGLKRLLLLFLLGLNLALQARSWQAPRHLRPPIRILSVAVVRLADPPCILSQGRL
jgi:hypothetical protein